MKWLVFSFSILFVAGCVTSNNVQRIESSDSIVRYKSSDSESNRFANLYPGKKDYPESCAENCYPSSEVVECESPAENCHFTGVQKPPELKTGFSVRWLGHASFYVQSPDGSSYLFDPVSGQFDWPVNWAFKLSEGFNRTSPSWISDQEIADTDAVLYSHIHYDHFNKADITRIGNGPEYFVPLGFAEHFPQGKYQLNEMAWFSSKSLGSTTVHFAPAHHFSSRVWVPYLYEDKDKTLWGGWVLEHQGKRLFFAGDTGYSEHFKDIQQRYGNMDICLLPIASYFHEQDGEWYRYVHTTPEDALVAAKELNCQVMIPWGYGNSSWKMGDRSSHSPLLRLLHMHRKLNSDVPLLILNEGGHVAL